MVAVTGQREDNVGCDLIFTNISLQCRWRQVYGFALMRQLVLLSQGNRGEVTSDRVSVYCFGISKYKHQQFLTRETSDIAAESIDSTIVVDHRPIKHAADGPAV